MLVEYGGRRAQERVACGRGQSALSQGLRPVAEGSVGGASRGSHGQRGLLPRHEDGRVRHEHLLSRGPARLGGGIQREEAGRRLCRKDVDLSRSCRGSAGTLPPVGDAIQRGVRQSVRQRPASELCADGDRGRAARPTRRHGPAERQFLIERLRSATASAPTARRCATSRSGRIAPSATCWRAWTNSSASTTLVVLTADHGVAPCPKSSSSGTSPAAA